MAAQLNSIRDKAQVESSLGMRCDEREIPRPARENETLVAQYVCHGRYIGNVESSDPEGRSADAQGPCAIAITSERLLGILAPEPSTQPAIWFEAPLGALNIEAQGSAGMFKKRPEAVAIEFNDFAGGVLLRGVSRLLKRSAQANQENALIDQLRTVVS